MSREMESAERLTTGARVLRLFFRAPRGRSASTLSADSQIALALYEAQIPGGSPGAPRSRDELAAMARQSRSGWSQVFKQLKAEGLLEEQTLGQVVARWNNRHGRLAASAGPEAAPRSAPWRAPSQTGS